MQNITIEQIKELRTRATMRGDWATVITCHRAVGGKREAVEACKLLIEQGM